MVMPIVAASLPVREVWIEIVDLNDAELLDWSLPVREVWIEIYHVFVFLPVIPVTSREGSVD